jgi:hypothetical protein
MANKMTRARIIDLLAGAELEGSAVDFGAMTDDQLAEAYYERFDKRVSVGGTIKIKTPWEPKLGHSVRTGRNNHRGIVYAIHHSFADTGLDLRWFDIQSPPVPASARSGKWVSILCDGGGSVCVPESDVVETLSKTPKPNGNLWYDFYFD